MKLNKITKIILILIIFVTVIGILYFTLAYEAPDGNPQSGNQPAFITPVFDGSSTEGASSSDKNNNLLSRVAKKISTTVEGVNDKYIAKPNVLYDVPFTPQAPYANWDSPFDEACEEASMLMAYHYFKGLDLDKKIADESIRKLIAWETVQGYAVDITAAMVVQVFNDYYKLSAKLIKNPEVEDIQQNLDVGNLVLVPAAGKMLGNPNFRSPGPLYHMLVVIGYDQKQREFITNDPGTRNGERYRYDYDVLMNAMHDWNDGDVNNGDRVVIVVSNE